GELFDDTFTQHVSHFKCLKMYLIIGSNRSCIVTIQLTCSFLESQVQVLSHHGLHLFERPVLCVRAVEKYGNLVSVGIPACDCIIQCGRISILCGLEYFSGNQNVISEQCRELFTSRIAIEWLNGIPNIILVLQQSLRS